MVSTGLAVYLAVIQVLFVLGWAVYAAYLPQLLSDAGLDPGLTPTILLIDQVLFMMADILLGAASDLVERWIGRLGLLIAGLSVVSGAAFMMMPILGAGSGTLLLIAIVIWSLTASALRGPPIVLLARYASQPRRPMLLALTLTGTAIGGALSPYLATLLSGISPIIPFALSGITLALATGGLVAVDQARRRNPLPAQSAPAGLMAGLSSVMRGLLVVVGGGLVAFGVQIHFFLNSPALYGDRAGDWPLSLLMPVFWVGFNLILFPAVLLARKLGSPMVSALAALLGACAAALCPLMPGLLPLVMAQLVAGVGWGAVFMAGLDVALHQGRRGYEGIFVGGWFASLSLAAAARIGIKLSGLDASMPLLLRYGAGAIWGVGALILIGLALWSALSRPSEPASAA